MVQLFGSEQPQTAESCVSQAATASRGLVNAYQAFIPLTKEKHGSFEKASWVRGQLSAIGQA
jgi:hypothetical protein